MDYLEYENSTLAIEHGSFSDFHSCWHYCLSSYIHLIYIKAIKLFCKHVFLEHHMIYTIILFLGVNLLQMHFLMHFNGY